MRRLSIAALAVVGCANNPQYQAAPSKLVAGTDAMGNTTAPIGSLQLPIKPESAKDAAKRMALATQLGVMVPYVKVGDISVEIEWTVHNDDATNPGVFKIQLDGGNEFFYYDPALVNLAPPNAEDPPKTPGLQGDIPTDIAAGASVSGLFREDQWLEASIDLDEITRGNASPFYEVLSVHKNDQTFQPMSAPMPANMNYTASPVGNVIPRAAFAAMVCFKLMFQPDRPMTMEYTVRVRDIRGTLLDPMGLDTTFAPRAGDVTFTPAAYTVGAATGTAQSPCLAM